MNPIETFVQAVKEGRSRDAIKAFKGALDEQKELAEKQVRDEVAEEFGFKVESKKAPVDGDGDGDGELDKGAKNQSDKDGEDGEDEDGEKDGPRQKGEIKESRTLKSYKSKEALLKAYIDAQIDVVIDGSDGDYNLEAIRKQETQAAESKLRVFDTYPPRGIPKGVKAGLYIEGFGYVKLM